MYNRKIALMVGAAMGLIANAGNHNFMRAPAASDQQGRIYTKSRSNGRRGRDKYTNTSLSSGRSRTRPHFINGNRQVINHRP